MNIAVCEDNQHSMREIAGFIRQNMPQGIDYALSLFPSGEEFLEMVYKGHAYEIVFMDYEMDGISGYEAALRMRTIYGMKDALLIYISNHSHLAIQLLPTQVFDFVPKPINAGALRSVLRRAVSHLGGMAIYYRYQDGCVTKQIEYGKIYYMMSDRHYVKLFTVDGTVSVKGKLDDFHARIDPRMINFRRIHKSYIINYMYLDYVGTSSVKMKNGDILNVSKPYMEDLKSAYLHFLNYQFIL